MMKDMDVKVWEMDGPNGYPISCKEWMPEGDPVGTLLCLHGFAGGKESLVIKAVALAMRQKGWRTVTFDWPAHNTSKAAASDLKIENCLKDLQAVVALCQESGLPMEVFATSFGGYLLTLYHCRFPETFQRIMLRSPALRMPHVLRDFMDETTFDEFRSGRMIDFGFDYPLVLGYDFYEDLLAHDPFTAQIPQTAPIKIIHGDCDETVPVQDSLAFAERTGAQIHIVKGANHRYQNPGDLDEIVSQALGFLG